MNKRWQLICGIIIFVIAFWLKYLPLYIISYLILGYDIFIKAFNNIKKTYHKVKL